MKFFKFKFYLNFPKKFNFPKKWKNSKKLCQKISQNYLEINDENYLKEFGELFKSSIERLVKKETERTVSSSNQNDFIQEIIHHANRAKRLTEKWQTRIIIMKRIINI